MSEVLISLLAHNKFHESYVYIMFGVGIEFFRVMTNLLNNVSQSEYKTTETIKPYVIGFIVSLGALSIFDFGTNYFMIPLVLGVAYLLVFIYMYINMKKLLNIKYEFNIIKTILFSMPFFIIHLINYTDINFFQNVILAFIFGLYFLLMVWQFSIKNGSFLNCVGRS